MTKHKSYSSPRRAIRSTSKFFGLIIETLRQRRTKVLRIHRRLLIIVVLAMGISWLIYQTSSAEDAKKAEKESTSSQSSSESAPPKDAQSEKLAAKQAEFMQLMGQLAGESQKDPNSPKLKELMQKVEKVSAELEAALKTQKQVDLTKIPGATDKRPPTTATGQATSPLEPQTAEESEEIRQENTSAQISDPQTVVEQIEKVISADSNAANGSTESETIDGAAVEDEEEVAEETPSEEMAESESVVESNLFDPNVLPDDDAIVQIKLKDDILDLNLLLEQVGKVMKFNILYDNEQGISGRVKMRKFGEIRRRDLLPLLESLLSFNGYSMIREDSFIRIVKRDVAHQTAQPLIALGNEIPELEPGDTVVAQIVEVKHIPVNDAKTFLGNFADAKIMVPVPNTSYLIITEYAHRLERLLDMLALIDQPGPEIKLETLSLRYTDAQDTSKQISELIKNLSQESSPSSTPSKPARTAARRPRRVQQQTSKTQEKEPAAAPIQTGDDGPVLIIDERTNRIFVIGDEQQIAQVKDLLSLLDVPDGPPIRLVPIEVKHVLAEEVGQQIVDLIRDINKDPGPSTPTRSGAAANPAENRTTPSNRSRTSSSSRRNRRDSSQALKAGDNGPFLHIDERTNRLLLIGSDEQIDQVVELLDLLDIPPREYEKLVLRVYRPEYVEAEEVRRILSDLGIITSRRSSPRSRANQSDRGRNDRGRNDRGRNEPIREREIATDNEQPGLASEPGLLPGEEEAEIRVAVQESTNKLFVLATERQQANISDIMVQVDLDAKDAMGEIQIYTLENREPAFVADMLIQLMESAYTQTTQNAQTRVPGAENAPTVVALDDIYAVAVRGSKKQHDDISGIIKILDKRLPSVLVEAILVQVSVDDSLDLGISMQTNAEVTNDPTNSRRVSGISPFSAGTISRSGNMVSGSGATIAFFDDDSVFATLEALQETGNSRIVSKPRILVNDNESGTIDSKREEPTTRTTLPAGSDTPIIEFAGYESAGTTLTITPHIGANESNALQLEIELNVDSFEGEGSENVPPAKSTNSVQTWVTVPDDMTIILGGLTREVDATQVRKVPLLGDIPIIGVAFRSTARTKDRGVLYVFVKAHIVGREGLDEEFQGLKDLTEAAKLKLKEAQIQHRKESIIPGIPDGDIEEPTNVFDD